MPQSLNKGILFAVIAALLFGASPPFAKLLLGRIPPVGLAGLLYLASGLGLLVWYVVRRMTNRETTEQEAGLTRKDLPWLAGAILAGGVAGPVLLMLGLTRTPATAASLLLNMEGVLTALLAWFVFHENVDRRVATGMGLIVVAGMLLSRGRSASGFGLSWGALLVVGACLCWAVDNNLTRKVSASDPVQIAGLKGLVAGIVNLSVAIGLGMKMPSFAPLAGAALLGFTGYGLSLVLFVLALRHLGTARTGAYFSTAPFIGAVLSLVVLHETPTLLLWLAGLLMGIGVWLHLSEHHEHEHYHERMEHTHPHMHDAHHQHTHDFPWDGSEPHTHPHVHEPMTHTHAHYPDIHHQHRH